MTRPVSAYLLFALAVAGGLGLIWLEVQTLAWLLDHGVVKP